ncbi:hypothetical protein LEP1GSC115_3787 [Leptospira interrogans serovar Australis str. 200703203]|uniref:Uncharacterized protein n=1 Tax=Leptospira interrogans serovar Australis str. 200703203 TaxID=1085541 RepID=N1ULQ8_LEPIR|nr:hypothetical protein LEP1GSC115_3787 [Leptospira interrogans serovar Australis str. 200703203]
MAWFQSILENVGTTTFKQRVIINFYYILSYKKETTQIVIRNKNNLNSILKTLPTVTTRTHENNIILRLFQNLKCGISHKKASDFK